MMIYRIKFEKAAQKFIEKQPKKQRVRLYKAIYNLPDGTDIKRLSGKSKYRLRVGNYRVIYTIDNGIRIITVESVDNRGDVYKKI